MKRSLMAVLTLAFLFTLPLRALAVELTLRNEEQSNARVALAYLQGDQFVVEGWFRLLPEQVETIVLHGVEETEVYIFVEFDDPAIKQFIANEWKVECLVADTDFRYALNAVGESMEPEGSLRKVPFQNIDKVYNNGKGKLWFNLNSIAG